MPDLTIVKTHHSKGVPEGKVSCQCLHFLSNFSSSPSLLGRCHIKLNTMHFYLRDLWSLTSTTFHIVARSVTHHEQMISVKNAQNPSEKAHIKHNFTRSNEHFIVCKQLR